MPAINTRGALSAQGFGFGAAQGAEGYKYLMLYSTGNNIFYSNTTISAIVPGTTPSINTGSQYWNGGNTYTNNGVAASGLTIAAGTARSTNNGATWVNFLPSGSWNYYYTASNLMAGGRNGGVALDPITKVAAGCFQTYDAKFNTYFNTLACYPTGSSGVSQYNAGGAPVYLQVTFWPAANRFYAPVYGRSNMNSLTTGGSGLVISAPFAMGAQPWCYDSTTGNLYWAANNQSVYNTTDPTFSSAGSYVGIDAWYNTVGQSVPVQGPGAYWYKLVRQSTSYVFVSNSASGYPTFSNTSIISTLPNPSSGQAVGKCSLYYEADTGRLWANAQFLITGSYTYYLWQTYYTTDFGGQWFPVSNLGGGMCFTKNTSYA